MPGVESHDNSSEEVGFDSDAFLELAQTVLTELRRKVLKQQNSHNLTELWMQDIWELSMPFVRNDLLSALFNRFPELVDAFDIGISAKKLYTLENLEKLVSKNGADAVAQRFFGYFAGRMNKRWRVFIEVENLEFGADFPELGTEDSSVVLRQLKEDERELFHRLLVREDRLNDFFFIAVTQAGDAPKAVEKARAEIQCFLGPFYLHRMRNPDQWWRARTQRNILSPVSFYVSEDETGARRELKQLKGRANELFLPDSPMEQGWKTAVQSLVSNWNNYDENVSLFERSLRTCSRWMFAAETDEDTENAFVRHCVAWEALLPGSNLRRSWYLLLLSAGSADRRCISTVSQGERLIDRRNKFVHPKAEGILWRTTEDNLSMLQQSLYYAFNSALRVMKRAELAGADYKWKKLLSLTFDGFIADDFRKVTDKNVLVFLDDLLLLDGNMLNESGEIVRAEALCVKAEERRKRDPQESVKHLAQSYHIATQHLPPPTILHVALWLKERLADMDEQEFKKAWSASGVTVPVPSVSDLDAVVDDIHRDHRTRPEDVGWKGS